MVEISSFLCRVQSLKLLQTAEEYESHIADDLDKLRSWHCLNMQTHMLKSIILF